MRTILWAPVPGGPNCPPGGSTRKHQMELAVGRLLKSKDDNGFASERFVAILESWLVILHFLRSFSWNFQGT